MKEYVRYEAAATPADTPDAGCAKRHAEPPEMMPRYAAAGLPRWRSSAVAFAEFTPFTRLPPFAHISAKKRLCPPANAKNATFTPSYTRVSAALFVV
jgi:hypothetical protein